MFKRDPQYVFKMIFAFFQEVRENPVRSQRHCQAGMIFRGDFVIWPSSDRKSYYVVDTNKKIVYFADTENIDLNTARKVTEDRELMLFYNDIVVTYTRRHYPTDDSPSNSVPLDSETFVSGTLFSFS